jgi:hypothetical protein
MSSKKASVILSHVVYTSAFPQFSPILLVMSKNYEKQIGEAVVVGSGSDKYLHS